MCFLAHTCTETHVCADSCWRDQSRVHDETRKQSVQSGHQVCILPTLSPWKQRDGRKTTVETESFRSFHSSLSLWWSVSVHRSFFFSCHPSSGSKVRISCSPAAAEDSSYLPSQCVKCRSMLWRVRKVQLSRGNSTLDGWEMGSHSSVITLATGGDMERPPKGRMWPVQWRTWRNRGKVYIRLDIWCHPTQVLKVQSQVSGLRSACWPQKMKCQKIFLSKLFMSTNPFKAETKQLTTQKAFHRLVYCFVVLPG